MDDIQLKSLRQKLFNKSVKGLASQNFERSVNDDNSCRYNGPGGKHCAIGHLITPKQGESLDTAPSTSVFYVYDKLPKSLRNAGMWFLNELQQAHDNAGGAHHMMKYLVNFANRWSLKLPKVLEDLDKWKVVCYKYEKPRSVANTGAEPIGAVRVMLYLSLDIISA